MSFENLSTSRAISIFGKPGLYLCSYSTSAFSSAAEIMHFVILEQQSNTLMTAGAVPRILALQMLYGERVKGWASEGRGKREFYEAGRHGSISRSTHT